MCEFFSAIMTRSGKLLYNFATNSHEDLIGYFKLADDKLINRNWVRIEFTPPSLGAGDKENFQYWKLKLDEADNVPWFDYQLTRKRCIDALKKIVVRRNQEMLLGGVWLLFGEVKVTCVKNTLIPIMAGESSIGYMLESSSVENMFDSSSIGYMLESSSVENMFDSSSISHMHDSSSIGSMHDSSSIGSMRDLSSVKNMYNSSSVINMFDSSSIRYMYGSSLIGNMRDSSSVRCMYNSSSVTNMYNSSSIINRLQQLEEAS